MEENKVAQITKHTDSSRSTDSGVSGNAQAGAREIRKNHWWNTREVNGHWVSKCADCGLLHDIHDLTEAEIDSATQAMAGQCSGKLLATAKAWLFANSLRFIPPDTEMHGSGHYTGSEVESLLAAFALRISEELSQSSEARPGVGTAVESDTAEIAFYSECSRLASRVEELENLIAKHSRSVNSADSASGSTSDRAAKETR